MSGYWVAEPGERGTHPAPPNTSCQSPSSQLGAQGGPAHWDARTHPPSCPAPFRPGSSVPSKFAFSAPNGRFPLALGSPSIGVYIRETEAQSHTAQNGLDSLLPGCGCHRSCCSANGAGPWPGSAPSPELAAAALALTDVLRCVGDQGGGNQLPTQ